MCSAERNCMQTLLKRAVFMHSSTQMVLKITDCCGFCGFKENEDDDDEMNKNCCST